MTAEPVEVRCVRRRWSTWTKCPCLPCTAHRHRMDKLWKAGKVPARDIAQIRAAARARLDDLLAEKWSAGAIASMFDLPTTTVSGLRRDGGTVRPGLGLARRLLADPQRPTAGTGPALVASRKLQALGRLGWTNRELQARLRCSASVVADIQSGRREIADVVTLNAIDEVYAELENTWGPSEIGRTRAERRGWLLPADWDDIEDPTEAPQPPSPETGLDLGEAMMLARTGCDREVAARRLGCASWKSLEGMLRNRRGGRAVIEKFKEER